MERRFVLFLVLAFAIVIGNLYVMSVLRPPEPPAKKPAAAAKANGEIEKQPEGAEPDARPDLAKEEQPESTKGQQPASDGARKPAVAEALTRQGQNFAGPGYCIGPTARAILPPLSG